jgi:16S rRNA (guanine527-N7)-methyltransferase
VLDLQNGLSYRFHVERSHGLGDFLVQGAAELNVELNEEQVAQCLVYLTELMRWNEKINLTGLKDEKEILVKHFLDSLACLRVLQPNRCYCLLDIGTGAGFPGLPLKIIAPDLALTLLEPNLKKTAFLRHIIGTIRMKNATVLSRRIEELVHNGQYRDFFSYILIRALNIRQIPQSIGSLLTRPGWLILWRSRSLQTITISNLIMEREVRYTLPYGYGERTLGVFERVGT